MCCLGLAGKAARDKTLIISVKIEFPVLVPIKRALLRLGCAAEDFTHFFKSLERNSERDPAQNSKMKIRSKRLLPFSVTESSWPPSTLPCSHLQICKWREWCCLHLHCTPKIRQCLCSHRFAAVLPVCCFFFFYFLIQLNSTMCFSDLFKIKDQSLRGQSWCL